MTTPLDREQAEAALRLAGLTPERTGEEMWEEAVKDAMRQGQPSTSRLGKTADFKDLSTLVRAMQASARRDATPEMLARAEALGDVLDLERECAYGICDGSGLVLVKPDPTRPGVGVPCKCIPLSARAAMAGIPERYRASAFENFEPMDGKTTALTEALAWDGKRSVVLAGDVGTGKTHLMCAMGIREIDRGRPVKFSDVRDFLDEIKARFGTDQVQAFYERIANVHTLLLDDLGAEQDTEWADAQLRALISHRYSRQLPTLITTNLGYSELRNRLGAAVASRMSEWRWVHVAGIDVRPTLAEV